MTTITITSTAGPVPGDTDAFQRGGLARLTPSERRVLELLAQGAAPKQAAWQLRVAISTVRSHIASAKRKTGARTLHQLVGAFAELAMPTSHAGSDR